MRTKASIAARLPVRRELSEVEAAVYLSLSPSKFRSMVDDKRMPQPRVADGRNIWDVEELDVAFKCLPRKGGEEATFGGSGGDSWDDFT
jgi:excisionase family DNA binding protein